MNRRGAAGERNVSAKPLDSTDEQAESQAPSERVSQFTNAVLWLLEAPDQMEVLSLSPWHPNDEDEDAEVPSGPGFLYGHRIRGTARVPTADRRTAVARVLVASNHEGNGWALCFDPHYAVRVSRGNLSAVFLICFWCGNARVIGPGDHVETYPFGPSSERLLRRELRRGGVGWLWFWRRWLP